MESKASVACVGSGALSILKGVLLKGPIEGSVN
jgi:hypothetical protein